MGLFDLLYASSIGVMVVAVFLSFVALDKAVQNNTS